MCRDGQCFLWPDRRTRASSGVFPWARFRCTQRIKPTYTSIRRAFSPKGATDYTDNTGRGLHGQQEAPDYADNTGHRSHGQHGSVCRDGQCFPWPDRCTRVSPGVFRGPGSAALRRSNQPIRRSEGLSRRRAPRITRITRDADYTDNKRRPITRTTRATITRTTRFGVPGRPVFSVARSLHASQSPCFPWARFHCTQRIKPTYTSIRRAFSPTAPRITDNTVSRAGDGQCFPWPDRRTRDSSSALRGPGCPGLRGSNQPIVDLMRCFLTECTPGEARSRSGCEAARSDVNRCNS